jgi:hypothetical protein
MSYCRLAEKRPVVATDPAECSVNVAYPVWFRPPDAVARSVAGRAARIPLRVAGARTVGARAEQGQARAHHC